MKWCRKGLNQSGSWQAVWGTPGRSDHDVCSGSVPRRLSFPIIIWSGNIMTIIRNLRVYYLLSFHLQITEDSSQASFNRKVRCRLTEASHRLRPRPRLSPCLFSIHEHKKTAHFSKGWKLPCSDVLRVEIKEFRVSVWLESLRSSAHLWISYFFQGRKLSQSFQLSQTCLGKVSSSEAPELPGGRVDSCTKSRVLVPKTGDWISKRTALAGRAGTSFFLKSARSKGILDLEQLFK